MKSLRILACALLFLLLPLRPHAQNVRWFEIKSGNFILFTDTSEAKGRRLVTDLEQRIASFQTAIGSVPSRQFPVEIFVFKQSEDFLSSAPAGALPGKGIDIFNNAYFIKGPDRYFIVAQDKSPDDIANDVGHALGHLFLDRIVMWHPFWLEEGAAEYFRKVGRNPDSKRVLPEDRISVADILNIVPSSTYNDNDPAGPFRIQSYRLLRIAADEHAAELRSYIRALRAEAGQNAVLAVDEITATDQLTQFTETRIPTSAVVPDIQAREAPASVISLQRGDLLVAARQTAQAANWYAGDTGEARAARAILGRMLSGMEAEPLMERAVRDFPDNGLVQFYFGSLESQEGRILKLQIEALERAVRLLPLFGRAHAELARVLTLAGRADEAFPLLDRALALEPEYADRFYLLRTEALSSLRKFDDAYKTSKLAASLPHADRATSTLYDQQTALLEKRIQEIVSSAERLEVVQLQASVEAEAARREPPRPPPPAPPPVRAAQIDYKIEATNDFEVVAAVLPDYLDSLVKSGKSGNISLQVNIGVDGHVTAATITDSQFPEMNDATVAATKRWTFKPFIRAGKPAAFAIKLSFNYSIK